MTKPYLAPAMVGDPEESFNRASQAVEWADALLQTVYARRWFSWNANTHVEFLERLARLVLEFDVTRDGGSA